MKKKFSLKISLGIQEEFSKNKKVVQEFEDMEKKLREQEARDTQAKRRKRDLRARRNSKRKPLRRRVM